jgi:hypothetical protein
MAQSNHRGFTLIGLLVILAMMAFFLGLLIPAIRNVREAAARTQCVNNHKQICLAVHACADSYKGNLPPTVGSFPADSKSMGTIFFYVLPYLEENELYRKAEGYCWKNATWSVSLAVLTCPSDASATPEHRFMGWLATSNYAANYLVFKQGGAHLPRTFRDGTSNTIMFAERYQMCNAQPNAWGYPAIHSWAPMFMYYNQGKFQIQPGQEHCNPTLAQSPHQGGISVGMGDGSVRFVSDSVSPETWYHACTPDGGEPLGNDF